MSTDLEPTPLFPDVGKYQPWVALPGLPAP
jgi:hypothetical protein